MSTTDRTGHVPAIELAELGDILEDPHPLLAELRRRGPAHFVRLPDGEQAWLIVGYQQVRDALSDPTLSKNWYRATGTPGPNVIGTNMLTCDPPDHTRLRRLVSRQFTARRLENLRPKIQELADTLLDNLAGRDHADLVADFALPLPVDVIAELLGVPFLDRAAFRDWCDELIVPSGDQARGDQVTEAIMRYIGHLINRKRAEPGEDLLSELVRTTDEEGDRLSADELRATTFLLLVAGHATTVNLISSTVWALLRHPDQLAELRADASLLDQTIEESLRYEGPLLFTTRRFTTEPLRVGSVLIPGGGERVLLALASADRDPRRFADPDHFDLRRAPKGYLAFGHGIHHCLGGALACLEANVAVGSLLRRFPGLSLDEETARWRRSKVTRGLERLPVRLDSRWPGQGTTGAASGRAASLPWPPSALG